MVPKMSNNYIFFPQSQLATADLNHDHDHGRGGFSVELIHRHSPNLTNAIRRSIGRTASFSSRISSSSAGSDVRSTVYSNGGEYLMTVSIGTPPFLIVADADIGNDLIWTQCKPCYKQTAPLFGPKSSTTYKKTPCASRLCNSINTGAQISCSSSGKTCHYSITYEDKSLSVGNIDTRSLHCSLFINK
ncbi:Aspartic peptidase [Trema orientale]|uniref:Aspartic peptidase n=1 Tax=Trema orientale TaxID=63057 RepID=A0A2P5EPP2_TREOI|nr:Aspartic peptidase [Trema orientale]